MIPKKFAGTPHAASAAHFAAISKKSLQNSGVASFAFRRGVFNVQVKKNVRSVVKKMIVGGVFSFSLIIVLAVVAVPASAQQSTLDRWKAFLGLSTQSVTVKQEKTTENLLDGPVTTEEVEKKTEISPVVDAIIGRNIKEVATMVPTENSITSSHIIDGTVSGADIAPASIEAKHLTANALLSFITSADIKNGTIVDEDIATGAKIDSDKISFLHNTVDLGEGTIVANGGISTNKDMIAGSVTAKQFLTIPTLDGATPLPADCNERSEYGRMFVDVKGSLLYLCTADTEKSGSGWRKVSLNTL